MRRLGSLPSAGLLAPVLAVLFVSCGATDTQPAPPPPFAREVDLQRYAGRWFELARLPAPFQKPDEAAVAEYAPAEDGTLAVRNIAVRPDGSEREIRGTARVLNPPHNTKLAVRFHTWFGPFIPVPDHGNYWIFHVDDDYSEAIVGTRDRRFLWLLAREPALPENRFDAMVGHAHRLGFDTTRLLRVPHPVVAEEPHILR